MAWWRKLMFWKKSEGPSSDERIDAALERINVATDNLKSNCESLDELIVKIENTAKKGERTMRGAR